MKKVLLTLVAGVGLCTAANAQFPGVETFNAAGLPAGWSMIKVDNNTPAAADLNATIVSTLTTNAWMKWPVSATDSCMLTVSDFTPAGIADRWLITPQFTVTDVNTVLKWQDYAADANYVDATQIWVSPSGGNTVADFTTKIYDAGAGTDGFTQRGVNIGAYNGQNIRLAFRDNSNNKYVLMVDNVSTTIPPNTKDAKNNGVTVKTLQLTSGSTNVVFNVTNTGAQDITSLKAQYVVDAAAPVIYTFTSLSITPFGSQNLQFTTPISGLATGSHTVTVTILEENGTADPTAADNVQSRNFAVVDPANSVPRNGLIEEFSSSTCVPCASFNSTFDPLVQSNNANTPAAHFNVVKYQMNWPNPGNDQSYNNSGIARRAYYDVNGIPDHFTNGAPGGAGNQAEIDASKTDPAFMTITGTYAIHGNQINASVTVTPKFTITGADISVQMSATERQYVNPNATTTQSNYVYVERSMKNSGDVAANKVANWVANTPQTFTYTTTYVNGTPAQGNDHFWTSAYQSDLVVFVQDNTDKSILQSVAIPATWPTGVKELNGIGDMVIFPNPAASQATLGFSTTESQNIDVSVVDVLGHTVYSYSQKFDAGYQRISIPLGDIATGIYNVRVQTSNGVATQRLTVAK